MPIVTNGPSLEPENKGIDEFHAGRMESLGAAASEAWLDLPTRQIYNLNTMPGQPLGAPGPESDPLGNPLPTVGPSIAEATQPAAPRIEMMDANHRVKQAGLAPHLKLPDQPDIPQAQLEIMMSRARQRREVEATMERGPGGVIQGTLEVGTSFLVSAVDPLNVASAFIPVLGELRYAKLLAGAGESAFARAGVRASVGAVEGAVGQALLEPIDWMSHTQDGRDFGMADVLHNIMFGAVLGGTLHTGGGAISDVYRARKERPMYPYDLGEPMESHTPWDELRTRQQPPPLPRDVLGEYPGNRDPIFPEAPDARVTPASLAAAERDALPDVPSAAVQTIDDLPQRAREDAARIGIANLIEGEPLRVGEALEAAAKTDPRIAESFDEIIDAPVESHRGALSLRFKEDIQFPDVEAKGYSTAHRYEIEDSTGAHVGVVDIEPTNGGKRLEIVWIGHDEGSSKRLDLGPANIRDLLRQVRQHYPDAETLTGMRIGGAHQGDTKDVIFPLRRSSVERRLDRDASWRALSHATPEFDDPNVVAASNAAAEVKRPPTKLDERLTAAEKADVDAKQMYDMFAEQLPEGERLRLDDLIKTIDSDHEARSIAIERGAACLFGARD